jgi:orotate phosphoribosyltransferase-like protein
VLDHRLRSMIPRKVTPEMIQKCKELNDRGLSQRNIAFRLKVSQYTVWQILHGVYEGHRPAQVVNGMFNVEKYRTATL